MVSLHSNSKVTKAWAKLFSGGGQAVLILPIVHTGMDCPNNTFQNLEGVTWPKEFSTTATVMRKRIIESEGVNRILKITLSIGTLR